MDIKRRRRKINWKYY